MINDEGDNHPLKCLDALSHRFSLDVITKSVVENIIKFNGSTCRNPFVSLFGHLRSTIFFRENFNVKVHNQLKEDHYNNGQYLVLLIDVL